MCHSHIETSQPSKQLWGSRPEETEDEEQEHDDDETEIGELVAALESLIQKMEQSHNTRAEIESTIQDMLMALKSDA